MLYYIAIIGLVVIILDFHSSNCKTGALADLPALTYLNLPLIAHITGLSDLPALTYLI